MIALRPAAIATAALAALTLSACSAADDGTSPTPGTSSDSAAVADDAFTLYAGRDQELIDPLIEQFESETGVSVDVRYAGSTELAALLLEEGDATPAGVFLAQDAGALGAVAKADMFATLPESITETVPAGFTSTDGSWVGVTGRARVVVYDSDQLSADEVPTTVAALTDEQWSSEVGIAPTNASFQSFVTALRVLEGEDVAQAWLEDMEANDVQIYAKNTPILEAANAGEIQLGLINHYYWYRMAAEVGADNMRAQLAFPEAGDAGGIVNVTGAGLLSGAADDADALRFIEYLVSESAQQYFVDTTFEYPLIDGVAAPEGLPALETLTNPELDLSDLDSLGETTDLLVSVGLL
ncbi:iron ABC transporter substrate-binding protein [Demequina muriae]|uniref:Iron ABC transporter substrate-binding protein n=1 Tax=Demequina muriae TaxID=3051664 RepID=A0ABT8GGN1_9MICO|nr:iron ABC transporter substrate-binding protein [Demequina sp. EGI L300058]MDN4480590.1 iron ABC transporter substrate-binding protein [Demequina sp. EGI L300058]